MSLTEDYWALVEKDEGKKKKKKQSAKKLTGNLTKDYYALLEEDGGTAPVRSTIPTKSSKKRVDEDDIAPVLSTSKKDDGFDFFQKGAFEDGYQFGDVTKAILGTVGDIGTGVVKGASKMVGGILDAGAYGVAGIADAMGNDDFADELRVKAKENVIDNAFKDWDERINQSSILGRTSDSIAEGLGQVASVILTGGLGAAAGGAVGATAATTGLMGVSSFGSGTSEAYQGGATDEEAATYGLIKGVVDAGSEMIFGGLGKAVKAVGLSKGLSSLDDVFARKLADKITSQTAKNFVEYGVKASAEGVEEVLAGIGSAVGKKLTYMDEAELSALAADENLLEQFVVGAVTSGVAQSGLVPGMKSGSLAEANKTGRDFITGNTVNEQKVIDKEYENRIAEQEQDGRKLTKQEKSKIYDTVVSDMEKGYISTDTIEEVLGGDTYKSYKDTIDSEDALQNEFDTLNKMKQGDMTGEQIDRRAELKEQLAEIKNADKRSQMQSQLRDEVFGLVKGDRLVESYNERARKGQAFEADLSKYDSKQQTVIQKAVESGILNNTNRTHEFVDMIAKISADKGVSFDFVNNAKLKESGFALEDGVTVNGFVNENGVSLNIDSAKSLNSVVGHEITHVLEGTELYDVLQKTIVDYAKSKGDYQSRYDTITRLYKNREGANLDAELTADLVGDYLFTDSDFIHNLSTNHRNVFQKIYDEIKYLCKVATAGSKEARELEKVKRAFEQAYKADSKTKGDTKYSMSAETDSDYMDAVNRGDMETAQEMVASVARENGYTPVKRYHQTAGGFTEFNTANPRAGLHDSETPNGIFFKDNDHDIGLEGKVQMQAYLKADNMLHFRNREEANKWYCDNVEGYAPLQSEYNSALKPFMDELDDIEKKMFDPATTDDEYSSLDEREEAIIEAMRVVEDSYRERLRELLNGHFLNGTSGYDGIELDYDGHRWVNGKRENVHTYIVFDPAQAKSADPVTYDDNGNVIPLSERFKVENPDIRYSLSSIANTFFGDENMSANDFAKVDYKQTQGYKDYVDSCVNNYKQTRKDFDEAVARKEIEDAIDGIVKVAIAAKRAGYDIYDDKSKRTKRDSKNRLLFSSLEPNSDYFTSSDISTICDKRKNFAEIYDDIVRAEEAKGVPQGKRFFDNVDNYFYLHKLMADKGLTQPCRQCYVESMRKNLAPMASAFLRLVRETDPNNLANDQLYQQKGKTKGNLKTNNAALRERVLSILDEYGMTVNDLTVETLTTEDGLASLKISAPLVYEAFNSFYGQSKPKMPKSATPFRFGELTALLTDEHGKIKKSLVDRINSTGGFRLQSYSDFQIQNFTDVLQVIFEAGTLGLTGHAYTKVPAFLDATEGTNLKRNISIFMYKDGNEWKLDKNDSFPYDLEDIYDIVNADKSGNTGIIAVSQNEDMSAWIMANDMVGYGIPFHKSGLKMGVVRDTIVREDGREIKGYSGTKDHTKQQTEVWARASDDHKALTKVKNGINIYRFWDFDNKSNLSKKELIEKNVKAYIDACNEAGYLPKFREYVMNNGKVLNNVLNYAKKLGHASENATIDDISFEYSGYRIPYGYYKFLGDFGMFTPDGDASPHDVLSLKSYDFDKAVKFFEDSETLRRNEILQQFSNGAERQKYRDSNLTAEELQEVVKQRRREVADGVVAASLSNEGTQHPVYGNYNVYGEDIALETAPVATSKMETTTEDSTVVEPMFPDDLAPMSEPIPGQFDSLTDEDMPPEMEAPYYEDNESAPVDDPFENRFMDEVGNPKVKAYMYENPEVKPFFQQEAAIMLRELQESTKGQKIYSDVEYMNEYGYVSQGLWQGQSRNTSEQIAYLLDGGWGGKGYTYAEIEKGLKAIIEDNGKENNACSKRIEFLLNDRLKDGYTDFRDGSEIPPDDGYLSLLEEKQITEYSKEAFDALVADGDEYAPSVRYDIESNDPAPTPEALLPDENEVGGTTRQNAKGQQKLFPESEESKPPVQQEMWPDKTAKILSEEPPKNKNQRGLWSMFKEYVLDNGMVFEDLSLKTGNRELQAKWHYIRNARAMAQSFMGKGKNGARALNDLRQMVENSGKMQSFSEYAYHLLNVDRMTLAQRYEGMENKPVFGNHVTAEQSAQKAVQLERANPEFKRWAKELYTINTQLREMLVEGGVLSRETANLWAEMYPHYIPIRRAGYEGAAINVALDTNRTGVNAPIKKATGGNRDILPMFDTMGQRTLQTYRAIAKNRFGLELRKTLGTTVSEDAAGLDSVIDSMDNEETLLTKGDKNKAPTFTVFENGKRYTFEITDEMYESMKPTSDLLAYTNPVLNTASNAFRGLLTEYNPVFMMSNAIKDAQDVLINSQHPARTYMAMPKAIGEMMSGGNYYREYMENGGEENTYFDGQENTFDTKEKGAKKLLGIPPLSWISKANNVIERLPRMAEYIASREDGRSIEVSMLDAARVTTNFAAGGKLTKFANRNGVTFLNASVQGAVQQARNIREAKANGLKGAVYLAAKVAVAGLPAMLVNHLLWDDDEDYEELSDYVKQDYYIVGKTGDGQFIRIPKGRTLAVIQNAFEQMENLVTGDDEVDLKAFLDLAVANLAPNNPIENNILAPIKQVAENKTWYGEDLVPTRLQDLPKAEQFDESTDSISKWLGEKQPFLSPYQINYLLDQYSGGVGDVFLPMLTPEAESGDNSLAGNFLAPLKKKFTTDAVMNNQNVSDFYDTKDELATNAKRRGATDEDVLKSKYFNSINSELSDLYAQKREIQNSTLPDDAKYNAVRDIQSQIVELTKEALNDYPNVSISGNYAEIGNRQYRKNDTGEWTKLSDKQTEKQDEVTDSLDISASEYWRNKEEYDFAYEKPEKYAVAKSVGGYTAYKDYTKQLYDIKGDDLNGDGRSDSGTRKKKVLDWINNLDADYGTKIILFKNEYNADDTYNYEIIEYLNSRSDISAEEMAAILKELGFEVDSKGNISW